MRGDSFRGAPSRIGESDKTVAYQQRSTTTTIAILEDPVPPAEGEG